MPPIAGTPDDTTQTLSLVPVETTTYRVRYSTNPGAKTTYLPDEAGTSVTGNTRGEFAFAGLTADTKYFWRVECYENARWKRGWEGSFTTLPTTGGEVVMLFGTDGHWISTYDDGGDESASDDDALQAILGAFSLLSREQDAHGYIDGGDTFHIHCVVCGDGNSRTDEFGRVIGQYSVTANASTEADELISVDARFSMVLRRMYRFLRFAPTIWSLGNHEGHAVYGSSGGASQHWKHRARPWEITGISMTLGEGNDLAADGTFSVAGHGMNDGDGPYRFAHAVSWTTITPPTLSPCATARAATTGDNEFFVNKIDNDSFKLAATAIGAGCEVFSPGSLWYGAGEVTLVKGSDLQGAFLTGAAKFLPNQNDLLEHGYGGSTDENGVMGPVLLSDYIMLLNLDEYLFTTGDDPTGPSSFPVDNRTDGAGGGWSLGTDQNAGVLALIAEIQDGDGLYEDVEVLIVVMHHLLGGTAIYGYPYGRGSLCNVDARCVSATGTQCDLDTDCIDPDTCENPLTCTDNFAHGDWQAIHEALEAFVIRTDGVALVVTGHDHLVGGGVKDGVYYHVGGYLGMGSGFPGVGNREEVKRFYDFDGDGIPAYHRHFCALAGTQCPAGTQGLDEWGTEHAGYTKLTICPSTGTDACASSKPTISLDYIINGVPDYPSLHGTSAPGFPLTLEGL